MTLEFSADWFTHNEYNLNKLFDDKLKGKKDFLEIGSFEGRSSCWFLNKIDDNARLTCIDTWEGSKEHTFDFNPIQQRFTDNVFQVKKDTQTLNVMKMTSFEAMARLIAERKQFDFIYIDGSHLGKDVMTDACMAFQLVRSGGVIVFDDYEWTDLPDPIDRPKMAIDYFITLFNKDINLIYSAYQLAIEKRGI
jgi:predicted O-methyltransferase YrrM